MKLLSNLPATLAATLLIEVYADIKIVARGLNILVNVEAGPVPIDRPKMITFSAEKPRPPSEIGFSIC
jgi:hypothetical protein